MSLTRLAAHASHGISLGCVTGDARLFFVFSDRIFRSPSMRCESTRCVPHNVASLLRGGTVLKAVQNVSTRIREIFSSLVAPYACNTVKFYFEYFQVINFSKAKIRYWISVRTIWTCQKSCAVQGSARRKRDASRYFCVLRHAGLHAPH